MLNTLTLKKYFRHTAGTMAVAFALLAPIIVGACGMALDLAQAYLVKERLGNALDAAALAGAAASADEDEVRARILDFFETNYPAEKLGVTFTPEVQFIGGDQIVVTGNAYYNTTFMRVLGIDTLDVSTEVTVEREFGYDLELSMVLDISGSMNNDGKITDLKEAAKSLIGIVVRGSQLHHYSKVALVPYGVAVNVGSYADKARGSVTGAAKTISAATKANPVKITTSSAHGFSNGQTVYITGVQGMTQINNKEFTISNVTSTTFTLGVNGTNYSTFKTTPSLGVVGRICTTPGCEWFKFTNANNSSTQNIHRISTCVSERVGTEAYKDTKPSTAFVAANYPAASNTCLTSQIVPLTSDKDLLEDKIDALTATGSTGGQVGVGWGWYMLSPEFNELWDEDSQKAASYDEIDPLHQDSLHKVVVLMTDGEYNSPYCKAVIAKDATTGSGNTADHINCNATNGNAYDQAELLCDAMKAKKIEIYTIGFKVSQYPAGEDLMEYCASDAKDKHFYLADDGDELKEAFEAIGRNIGQVHLAK